VGAFSRHQDVAKFAVDALWKFHFFPFRHVTGVPMRPSLNHR
jgi:hypothetical protein